MNMFLIIKAWMLYQDYLNTQNVKTLIRAQEIAHDVGERCGACPWLFRGNKNLEREWASGRGDAYFTQYCMNGLA